MKALWREHPVAVAWLVAAVLVFLLAGRGVW